MEITLENIKAIFKSEVDPRVDIDNFDPDRSIMQQGVDSLDRSSVFLALEEAFNVKITDGQIEELGTLNSILDFLQQSAQEKSVS
jgi:acyl carrier protein